MKRLVPLLFGFGVNACSAEPLPGASVPGNWVLEKTSVGEPGVLFIREHRVTFAQDGTWHYAARMGGRYDGLEITGSGQWKVTGDTLEYTAGDSKGVSRLQINGSTLMLSPDPVLVFNGVTKIDTYYRRAP